MLKYAALLCLLSSPVHAEKIVLLPPLRVGEAISLEMTMSRERTVANQPPTKGSGTTPVRVEILEAAAERTVVGWTLGKPRVNDPLDADTNKALDPLVELFTGQTIELVFDKEFTAESIRNLDHVIALTTKTLDVLQKSLPKEQADVAIPRVRQMFANPKTVQTVMMQKPARYFLVYGWELEPGKPRTEDMSLPSPFGGGPLPAKVTVELKPFQPADTHYVVLYKQELDKEGVDRVIRAAVQKIAGDKYSPDQPLPKFDVEDSGEFKLNRSTGWVEHAVVKRTTTSSGGSQAESFEFRHVKSPDRPASRKDKRAPPSPAVGDR